MHTKIVRIIVTVLQLVPLSVFSPLSGEPISSPSPSPSPWAELPAHPPSIDLQTTRIQSPDSLDTIMKPSPSHALVRLRVDLVLTNPLDFPYLMLGPPCLKWQMLTYLLMSASSSAATRIDDWLSNWGKDKFPDMASASVAMSFLAYVALASSSLISGYTLCTFQST